MSVQLFTPPFTLQSCYSISMMQFQAYTLMLVSRYSTSGSATSPQQCTAGCRCTVPRSRSWRLFGFDWLATDVWKACTLEALLLVLLLLLLRLGVLLRCTPDVIVVYCSITAWCCLRRGVFWTASLPFAVRLLSDWVPLPSSLGCMIINQ